MINYKELLIDRKFGNLTVLKFHHTNKHKQNVWECKCSCGNITLARTDALEIGHKKSCGCLSLLRDKGNISKRFRGCGELSMTQWSHYRYRAKKSEMEFCVTIEQAWDLFLKQDRKCKLSGIELFFSDFRKNFKGNASLDRIDSKKGYTIDNVQWVDKRINFMKQSLSDKDFINLCQIVVDYQKNFLQMNLDKTSSLC